MQNHQLGNKQSELVINEDNGTRPYINPSASTLSPADANADPDNTVTFLIGFGVLILFVVAGIMASVFLCVTLKKDPYLWEVVFDGGPAANEEQPQQQESQQPSDTTVIEEAGGSPAPSSSTSNKKVNNDNDGCCSSIPVDSYTVECHRNADAIL